MGLPLPTITIAYIIWNRPAFQPLRLPNIPRPHQPTSKTTRPLRRRRSCSHHLHLHSIPNQRRSPSTHPSKPLPSPTSNQHLTPLLLPQRHLRLPHPRPRSTHLGPTPILHRNNPPDNRHHLQGPPHPSPPPSPDLADPNRRSAQDPAQPRHHHNHHDHGTSPPVRSPRLPTIHTRLQPHKPGKRHHIHDNELLQHNPALNPPIHTQRTLHQPSLDSHHSHPLHHNPRNSMDQSTKHHRHRRRPARTRRLAHSPKNRIRTLHRLGNHTLLDERKTQTDNHHNRTPPTRRRTRLLVILTEQRPHTRDRLILRAGSDQPSHPNHRSHSTSLCSELVEEEPQNSLC